MIFNRSIGFSDQKNDLAFVALNDLDSVAGLADQVRDVDNRQRIGAMHFEEITRRGRFQRLARLERRQRTFESGQVEFCCGHRDPFYIISA